MPRCVSPDFCWALPSPCCVLSPVTWPMMFLAPAAKFGRVRCKHDMPLQLYTVTQAEQATTACNNCWVVMSHTSDHGVNSALDVALGLSRVVLQQKTYHVSE